MSHPIRPARLLFPLACLLILLVLPARAQSLAITSATPDDNGDGVLTDDEFGQIIIYGDALDTVHAVTLHHLDSGATCSLPLLVQTIDEARVDAATCPHFPSSGAFRITASNTGESDSDDFSLLPGGSRGNYYHVGD